MLPEKPLTLEAFWGPWTAPGFRRGLQLRVGRYEEVRQRLPRSSAYRVARIQLLLTHGLSRC